jgi:conjugal transfer pilus assembly protein TraV
VIRRPGLPAATTAGLVLPVALLCGCASSLSGLSGSSNYACKAPEGVTCQSVSGTYANAAVDKPLATRGITSPPPVPVSASAVASPTLQPSVAPAPPVPPAPATAPSPAPIRSAPLILRLWFKAWEDADGDLFDQGHIYVQVNGGRWLVEHAQRTGREAHSPVRAAAVRGASEPPPTASARSSRGPATIPTIPTIAKLPPLPIQPMRLASEDTSVDQEGD